MGVVNWYVLCLVYFISWVIVLGFVVIICWVVVIFGCFFGVGFDFIGVVK